MKIILILFLSISISAFGQVSKNVQRLADEYDNLLSNIPDPRMSDDFEREAEIIKEKEEKLSLEFENSASTKELFELYKSKKNTFFKTVVVKTLLKKTDTATLVKLFKETVYRKDSLNRNVHGFQNFDRDLGYFLQNKELFEKLTCDSKGYFRDTPRTRDLLNFIIDSKPTNVQLLENVQYSIPITEEFYKKVRPIVEKERSYRLLPYIAKFKKKDDIELIKSFGDNALSAIREFPDNTFLPFLESLVGKRTDDMFFPQNLNYAVKEYCSQDAIPLIKKMLADGFNMYDFENIINNKDSIEHSVCPIYYPIFSERWISEGDINEYVFTNYTSKKMSQRELEDYIYKGFINNKIVDSFSSFMDDKISPSLKLSILKRLKPNALEKYSEVVGKYIREIEFAELLDFIELLDDNRAIEKNMKFVKERVMQESYIYSLVFIGELKKKNYSKIYEDSLSTFRKRKDEIDNEKNEGRRDLLKEFLQKYSIKL